MIFVNPGGLKERLEPGEMVETDDGYAYFGRPDDRCCIRKMETEVSGCARGQARARHESVNGRIKDFNIMRDEFRHGYAKHSDAFRAVIVLVQLMLETTNPPFQVAYPDAGVY